MHVVCWDLDETLGHFREMAEELLERMLLRRKGVGGVVHRLVRAAQGEPVAPAAIVLREGISEVLRALEDAGVVHVLTTAAHRAYADECVERAGIAASFAHRFTREEIVVDERKRYQPVLERVGCEPADLLIVGDAYQRDRPSDHPRIPMIIQPHGWEEPAAPLQPLILAMLREPTFLAGWERLYAEATEEGRSRRVALEGVTATIDRWGPAQPDSTPVLVEVSAT